MQCINMAPEVMSMQDINMAPEVTSWVSCLLHNKKGVVFVFMYVTHFTCKACGTDELSKTALYDSKPTVRFISIFSRICVLLSKNRKLNTLQTPKTSFGCDRCCFCNKNGN
jgi:hypothetical protein